MRVGIDQARRQDRVGLVDLVPGRILPKELRRGSDLDNAVAPYGDGSVFDHPALRIFGDDVARAPDNIHRLLLRRLGRQACAKEQRDGDRTCEANQTIRLAL